MEADKELKSIINSGRIPNAFLFEGPAGSGKLKSAIGFAQSLFMLNSSTNNLNTNFSTNLAHPDFHIIFPIPNSEKKAENSCDFYCKNWIEYAVSNNLEINIKGWNDKLDIKKQPQIGINTISTLYKKLSLSSFALGYKVVLFWMADRINNEAGNKLLKLVEEPGNKTVFIFIAEDRGSILKTLDSRCQKIYFTNKSGTIFSNNDFYENLFSELTRNAFQAKSNKESLANLVKWSETTSKLDREEIKSFLKYSNEIFRQAYLNNIGLQQYVKFKSSFEFNFEAFSKYVNDKNIEQISGLFEESHYHIKRWANNKMVMTNLAFDLTKLIHM